MHFSKCVIASKTSLTKCRDRNDEMLKTNLSIYLIDIIALFFLYGLLHSSNILNKNRKKSFLFAIMLTVIVILLEAGTILTSNENIRLRSLIIFFNVFGFALSPVIPIALIAVIDIKFIQTHKIMLLPTFINIAAAILSPLLGLIFYVDANNQYIRGYYFFVFVMVYIINLILLFISTFLICKKHHYPIIWKSIFLSVFTIAGTSIQLIVPSVYISWHCITLSLILYFLLLSEFDNSFDTLSGLYNRATFEKAVKQIKRQKAFSVIAIDINDFKIINDTYGHNYGDSVINSIAIILKESLDSRYTCYRVGGDEFCILCKELNKDNIEYHLKKITDTLSEKRAIDSRIPTIAYGYSVFQGGKKPDFEKIHKEADDQMYRYKKLHKDLALKSNGD